MFLRHPLDSHAHPLPRLRRDARVAQHAALARTTDLPLVALRARGRSLDAGAFPTPVLALRAAARRPRRVIGRLISFARAALRLRARAETIGTLPHATHDGPRAA